jgi:hypothetical protein
MIAEPRRLPSMLYYGIARFHDAFDADALTAARDMHAMLLPAISPMLDVAQYHSLRRNADRIIEVTL